MFKEFFFEYFYYRLYSVNKNKGEYQGIPSTVVISLVQTLIIGGIVGVIIRLMYDRTVTSPYAQGITQVFIGLYILLFYLNFRKFDKNISLYQSRWEGESRLIKNVKTLMIILVVFLSLVPLIAIGIFW